MMQPSNPHPSPENRAESMIRGAAAIAEFVFGDRRYRRRVYHLVETSKFPVVRIGATLCLRPSTYAKWLESQEARNLIDPQKKS
jgi:hypothetical protein